MKTIYVLTSFNPKNHGPCIVPFKSIKKLSQYVDFLSNVGFNEFIMEKRRVTK